MAQRMNLTAVLKACPSLLYSGAPSEYITDRRVFTDLNLDRLMHESIIEVLSHPLSRDEIAARQEIFRSLDNTEYLELIERLYTVFTSLTQALDAYKSAQTTLERLFLFVRLAEKTAEAYSIDPIPESGLLCEKLNKYIASPEVRDFTAKLNAELEVIKPVIAEISSFSPEFTPRGGTMKQDPPETSLCAQLLGYASLLGLTSRYGNTTSEQRLTTDLSDAIMRLYPTQCDKLMQFEVRWEDITEDRLHLRRGDVNYYLTLHELLAKAHRASHPLCFPKIADTPVYRASQASDLSLLIKSTPPVTNDIDFDTDEPIFFLTGANGGGKTTYLRTMAINLLLFIGGAPICAASAEIYPFGGVFTHFPSDERFTGSGRLLDEKQRMDSILSSAAKVGCGFAFLNESFSGTDDRKGLDLILETVKRLKELHCFVLFVTHFHEVGDSEYPVLTTVIDESDDNRRTYRIARVGDKRSSFARDILKKYRLDRDSLEKRTSGKGVANS